MISYISWCLVGAVSGVVVSSFFEWTLHRFVMHKPLWKFRYPFEAHAIVHHQTFKSDHTYHLIKDEDKKTIPMAWWNGPVLVFFCQMPVLLAAIALQSWSVFAGGAIACSLYYATYEYIHWCMHLPRKRAIERSGLFFRLNGHHLLHHRYMGKNFNVVFPLADLILGTLVLRSPIRFPQPQGAAVPNVQP